MAVFAGFDAPNRGDSFGHLRSRKSATEPGLGSLAKLDLDGIGAADGFFAPPEISRCHLQDVPAGGVAGRGQHPALAGADDGTGGFGAGGE